MNELVITRDGISEEGSYCSGKGLLHLIEHIDNPCGIEIGCDVGDTSDYLLSNKGDLSLLCIDPYEDYVDWNGHNLVERESTMKDFLLRMTKHGQRVNLMREKSDDVARIIADGTLDFVFIDGLHTYDQVKKDCQNYYDKVKVGGIFAGHDYHAIDAVRKAVDEFAAEKGATISTTDHDVWYWVKE